MVGTLAMVRSVAMVGTVATGQNRLNICRLNKSFAHLTRLCIGSSSTIGSCPSAPGALTYHQRSAHLDVGCKSPAENGHLLECLDRQEDGSTLDFLPPPARPPPPTAHSIGQCTAGAALPRHMQGLCLALHLSLPRNLLCFGKRSAEHGQSPVSQSVD